MAAIMFPSAWVVPFYAEPRTLGVLDWSGVAHCTRSACVGQAAPRVGSCRHMDSPMQLKLVIRLDQLVSSLGEDASSCKDTLGLSQIIEPMKVLECLLAS